MQLRSGRIVPNLKIPGAKHLNFEDTETMAQNQALNVSSAVCQPTQFSGTKKENIKSWLNAFDKAAVANGWSTERRFEILPAFLVGRASEFFDTLNIVGNNLTYDQIKQSLIDNFTPKGESGLYWNELNMRYMLPTETVEDFAESICSLLYKAYPDTPSEDLSVLKLKYFMYRVIPQYQQILLQRAPESLTFECALKLCKRQEIAIKQMSMFPMASGQSTLLQSTADQTQTKLLQAVQTLNDRLKSSDQTKQTVSFASENALSSSSLNQFLTTFSSTMESLGEKLDDMSSVQKQMLRKLESNTVNDRSRAESSSTSDFKSGSKPGRHCNNCGRDNHWTNQCRAPRGGNRNYGASRSVNRNDSAPRGVNRNDSARRQSSQNRNSRSLTFSRGQGNQ